MIVVDASVLATALADDGPCGVTARARLGAADQLSAPDLVDLEVLSVWRRHVRSGQLTEERCAQGRKDLAELPLERFGHVRFLEPIWAMRENLTPYDAAYVALAAVLAATLVTGDRRLAGAPGLPCDVELLEDPPAPA